MLSQKHPQVVNVTKKRFVRLHVLTKTYLKYGYDQSRRKLVLPLKNIIGRKVGGWVGGML